MTCYNWLTSKHQHISFRTGQVKAKMVYGIIVTLVTRKCYFSLFSHLIICVTCNFFVIIIPISE